MAPTRGELAPPPPIALLENSGVMKVEALRKSLPQAGKIASGTFARGT